MKHLLNLGIGLILIGQLVSCISNAPVTALNGKEISAARIDSFLNKQMDSVNMPGLSIAFINDGKIVLHRELGYADLESKKVVDELTLFEAASMSKTVFAYFVMQQVEKGILTLDEPLYKILPFEDLAYDERHKLFTARMVLAHTTGLPNWHEYQPPDPSLNVPEGHTYIMFEPGTQFSYSGEAYQYLVDVLAHLLDTDQEGLAKIYREEMAKPLGMDHAYFDWSEFIKEHRATGYFQDEDSGLNEAGTLKEFNGFSAAGGIRTNALSFANFIIALMDEKGLKKHSFNEMFEIQSTVDDWSDIDHWGLGIGIKETPYGIRYMHSGNNGDYHAYFIMYKEQKSGWVFLTNCNRSDELFESLESFFRAGE
ncbi:serine hydrolase domain-containing protein [Ulvibacterium marinum]|uniref:Class A beta-lactamase-related serine hydrolase n=1 Tax=Ulvibacterium marinum TaxID=2419782 RepID=A0A3B0CGP7_9FLAO|nr:serine hydrolase domain-containing protein [Ulvibacterium marinum]RKN83549.1 class A beta-lactamase-related serine hydrolase [Ulvibacterium marinum]